MAELILPAAYQSEERRAYLEDDIDCRPEVLQFNAKDLRDREEAQEPGGFARFLAALPASVTALHVLGMRFASLHELCALCQGIMLPSCTLQSLELSRIRLVEVHEYAPCAWPDNGAILDTEADNAGCNNAAQLIQDALLQNTSLTHLTIDSDLCSPDHWASILSRSNCSIINLDVKLLPHHSLDHLLGIFIGLACNTISLTTLSITHETNSNVTPRTISPDLEAERQLASTFLTNTSLTSLNLYDLSLPTEIFGMFFDNLCRSPYLTSLLLNGYMSMPGQVVSMLFTSLEKNPYLTTLSLSYCCGEDWPSASSVLDSLRNNSVLCELELYETPFEDEDLEEIDDVVLAQLEMNREKMLKPQSSFIH